MLDPTIRTGRERLRIGFRIILFLLGAAVFLVVGAAIAAFVTGHGVRFPDITWRNPLAGEGSIITGGRHWQWPLLVHFEFPIWHAALGGLPLVIGWFLVLRIRSRRRRYPGQARERGFAKVSAIRREFGRRQLRRTARTTLPGTTRLQRFLLPASALGFQLGYPYRPQSRRTELWCGWETKLRVVARAGWGKSWRLLIPIVRQLPGPAVVTSVEGEIFNTTVKARKLRLPPVRYEWMRKVRKTWRTPRKYPVYVVDLAKPEHRMAAGFPQVRFNPIVGCEDFKVAANRARALISGGDQGDGSDSTDKFFRNSATQVLAAWLQAAATNPSYDIENIVEWLRTTDISTPEGLLRTAVSPEALTAITNMTVNLDAAAGRTTSGVKRYLNFAVSSLSSGYGRELCGSRNETQFDMMKLVRDEGTLYLLAEPEEIELARPLLTMLAQEVYLAAERVARSHRKQRLPRPFIGVHDELKAGIRQPILPYTAAVQRKYGISYAYAVQTAADEEDLYGQDAAIRLRTQATWIIGGHDPASGREVATRAGRTRIVTASRGSNGQRSESTQEVDVLPESAQADLADGYSAVLRQGIAPFLAYTPRADASRKDRRTIRTEANQVSAFVMRHRQRLVEQRETADLLRSNGSTIEPAVNSHH